MSDKIAKIDQHISDMHELLDNGFYPEEYHKFTGNMENHMSEIETLTNDLYREIRDVSKATGVLTLYPEDFEKTNDWKAVCEQMDVEPDVASMTIQTLSVESVRDADE